ncbi:protein of unknown function [Methylorubrum extorquens]|uniref:Uncharacterized protein n=1 Tax=Methylorubrum extorquens TaxID=408 RepID=A0A2N9ANE1_METEX|nr:protein of unknown function [Methylorubrum extorquens]
MGRPRTDRCPFAAAIESEGDRIMTAAGRFRRNLLVFPRPMRKGPVHMAPALSNYFG